MSFLINEFLDSSGSSKCSETNSSFDLNLSILNVPVVEPSFSSPQNELYFCLTKCFQEQ